MKINLNRGISIKEGNKEVVLDPNCSYKGKENPAIFSHAHFDHIRGIDRFLNGLATKETIDLAEERYSKKLPNLSPLDYESKTKINGINVSIYNSGHVLGSVQIKVSLNDKEILYTGDLKPSDGLTTKGAKVMGADVLIIESTYGNPLYSFPSKKEVQEELVKWIKKKSLKGRNILLGGYVLGKAQELTKLLNDADILPLVHPKIYKINKIYERHGRSLGNYISTESEEGTEIINSGEFICIVPPSNIKERILDGLKWLSGSAHISTAVATGWAVDPLVKFRYGCEKAFPLSDHADFNELLKFVEKVDPEIVYTMHGFANRFAKEIKERLQIQAKPIGLFEQKKVFDFF